MRTFIVIVAVLGVINMVASRPSNSDGMATADAAAAVQTGGHRKPWLSQIPEENQSQVQPPAQIHVEPPPPPPQITIVHPQTDPPRNPGNQVQPIGFNPWRPGSGASASASSSASASALNNGPGGASASSNAASSANSLGRGNASASSSSSAVAVGK